MDKLLKIIANRLGNKTFKEVKEYLEDLFEYNNNIILEKMISFFGEEYRDLIIKKYNKTAVILYLCLTDKYKLQMAIEDCIIDRKFYYTVKALNEIGIKSEYISLTLEQPETEDNKIKIFLQTMLGDSIITEKFDRTYLSRVYEDKELYSQIYFTFYNLIHNNMISEDKKILIPKNRREKTMDKIYTTFKYYAKELEKDINVYNEAKERLKALSPNNIFLNCFNKEQINCFSSLNQILYEEDFIHVYKNFVHNEQDNKVIIHDVLTMCDRSIINAVLESILNETYIIQSKITKPIELHKIGISAISSGGDRATDPSNYIFNSLLIEYMTDKIVNDLHQQNIILFNKNNHNPNDKYQKIAYFLDAFFDISWNSIKKTMIENNIYLLEKDIGKKNYEDIRDIIIALLSDEYQEKLYEDSEEKEEYRRLLEEEAKEMLLKIKDYKANNIDILDEYPSSKDIIAVDCQIKVLKRQN